MKYCTNCGNELVDAAVVCPRCGTPTASPTSKNNSNNGDSQIAKGVILILLAIGIIVATIFIGVLPFI